MKALGAAAACALEAIARGDPIPRTATQHQRKPATPTSQNPRPALDEPLNYSQDQPAKAWHGQRTTDKMAAGAGARAWFWQSLGQFCQSLDQRMTTGSSLCGPRRHRSCPRPAKVRDHRAWDPLDQHPPEQPRHRRKLTVNQRTRSTHPKTSAVPATASTVTR